MRRWLVAVCLLVVAVIPRGSSGTASGAASGAGLPRWPYPETLCDQRPGTPAPAAFGPAATFGGDEHTNITAVAFGRLGGRAVAVSTGQEGTMRVWALPGLTPIGEPARSREIVPGDGLTVEVPPAPANPGNTLVSTARMNGRMVRVTVGDEMRVVAVATGRQVGRVMHLGEDNSVGALVLFTLGGRLTAAVNDNGGDENDPGLDQVTLWDLATGKETGTIGGDFSTVRKATINGRTVLLTVNRGAVEYELGTAFPPVGTVSLWDPATRTEIGRLGGNPPPQEPEGGYTRSIYDRVHLVVGELDGRPVALTGGGDNALRLWDLTTETLLAATTPNGHIDEVESFSVAELDGRRVVVSGGADGTVMVWDLVTRQRVGSPLTSPAGVKQPLFTEVPGLRPFLATWDGTQRFWWLNPGGTVEPAFDGLGAGWVISFHGRAAHLGEEAGRVRLRDLNTGAPIGSPVPVTGEQPIGRVLLTQVAGRDVVIDVRNRLRMWDLQTGRRLGTILDVRSLGSRDARPAVAQARCTTLVLSGMGAAVRVWDLGTGRELFQLTGHSELISHIRTGLIGDRPIAVTSSADGTARIWNLTDGRQLGPPITIGRRYGVIQLTHLNGHTLLIMAGRDERVRLWDLGGR
ncbi:hypothetical protein Acor_72640 [Acrocarpospora corrugata]|uniref:Uncharacterized protein n=1 Tax=Acrocarpospora corrugata TaxID=35763 RepID=A0A5M3W8N9_9ACTN|nr:WD40 repeat domain-containing protein [Acrocarpospora corrugata]GES05196.1 hypothetical protein Acor_72640 [Acrocarpospora corrugata]